MTTLSFELQTHTYQPPILIRRQCPDLHDMHHGSPARQRVPVHGIQDCLRNRLEQVLRFLFDGVSAKRGSAVAKASQRLTRSGSHRPSATPYSLSVAVPATAKSFGVVIHPILAKPPSARPPVHPPGLDSRIHRRDKRFRVRVQRRRVRNTRHNRLDKVGPEPDKRHQPFIPPLAASTHRFSYNVLLTRCVKVSGVISRSSFMRYMLTRKRRDSRRV